jgi:L-lactate dehydrogenase (cytochrome)
MMHHDGERAVARAAEAASILVDTGVTTGADLVAARALGARAALVGRAYLDGLMACGEAGVARALEILRAEVVRTLQLLGVERVDDLDERHPRLLPR